MSQEKMNIQFRIKAVDKFSRVMHNFERKVQSAKRELDGLSGGMMFDLDFNGGTALARAENTTGAIKEAIREIPEIELELNDTNVDRKLLRLKEKLKELDTKFSVDADTKRARDKLRYLDTRMKTLKGGFDVDADTGAARTKISELQAMLAALDSKKINVFLSTTGAERDIYRLKEKLKDLDEMFVVMADTSLAEKDVERLRRKVKNLSALSSLNLNTTQFDRKIKQVEAKLKRLRKHTIELDLDTSKFDKQMAKLRKNLHDKQMKVRVGVDDKELNRSLARIEERLGRAGKVKRVVDVDVDNAVGEVAALEAAVDTATRDRTIDVNVKANGLRALRRLVGSSFMDMQKEIRRSIDRIADFSRDVGELLQHSFGSFLLAIAPAFSAFTGNAIAGLAGIGNMAGVTVGALMALGTAFIGAGAGAAAVGGLAVGALKDVFAVSEDLARLQDKLDITSDAKKRAKIQKEMAAYMATLSKEEQGALKSMNALKAAWSDMSALYQPQMLNMFTQAMQMLKSVLADLAPLFDNSVAAAQRLMNALEVNLKATDVQKFFDYLNNQGGAMFDIVTRALGNFTVGILNLFRAFSPLADEMAVGFLKMSESFRKWTDSLSGSKEMQSFMDYIRRNWPKVKNIVGSVILGIVDVFKAFAPHSEKFMDSLSKGADKFQAWAKKLGENQSFKDFIAYIEETAPLVKDFLLDLGGAIASIIEAAEPLAPVALKVASAFLKIVETVMDSWLGTVIIGIISLTSAISFLWPILRTAVSIFGFLGRILGGWPGLLRLVTGAFRILGGPIGWVIALAIELGIVIYQNWDKIVAWTKEKFGAVKDFIVNAWTNIKTYFTEILPVIVEYAKGKFEEPKQEMSLKWEAIKKTIVTKLMLIAQNVARKFIEIRDNVKNKIEEAKQRAQEKFEAMRSAIATKIASIASAVRNKFLEIKQQIQDKIEQAKQQAQAKFEAMRSTVATKLASIASGVRTKFIEIKTTIQNKIEEAKATAIRKFEALKSGISEKLAAAKKLVTDAVDRIKNAFNIDLYAQGKKIIGSVAKGIRGAIGEIGSAMTAVTSKLRGFLPFSPAKWGPLSDIHRLNFGGPISDSIYGARGTINRAMNSVLELPSLTEMEHAYSVDARAQRNAYSVRSSDFRPPEKNQAPIVVEVPVQVDGDEIARATYDSRKRVDGIEEDRKEKFTRKRR